MLSQDTLKKIANLENAYQEKTQQLEELNKQKDLFIPDYYFDINHQGINMSEALEELQSKIEEHETENKNNFINAIKTLSNLFLEEQTKLKNLNEKINNIVLELSSLKTQLQELIYSEQPELKDLISVQFYKAYDENMQLNPSVGTILKHLNPLMEEIVYNTRHKIVFKFEHRATSEELFSYFKSLVPYLDNNMKSFTTNHPENGADIIITVDSDYEFVRVFYQEDKEEIFYIDEDFKIFIEKEIKEYFNL